jgi:hypothetical protein
MPIFASGPKDATRLASVRRNCGFPPLPPRHKAASIRGHGQIDRAVLQKCNAASIVHRGRPLTQTPRTVLVEAERAKFQIAVDARPMLPDVALQQRSNLVALAFSGSGNELVPTD